MFRCLLLGVMACCFSQVTVCGEEPVVSLFDGQTLEGWEKVGGDATFVVEDQAIVGTSAPNTPNTFLCTTREFDDFELTYEFQCDDELNSGVQIRSQRYDEPTVVENPDRKRTFSANRVHGYQVEIDPNKPDRLWMGGIYDEARRGWLFPGPRGGDGPSFTEQGQRVYKPGEWNQVRVVCQGDHIRTWLNGEPRADFRDDWTPAGFIALQVHGVGPREDPLQVRWRQLQLRPLASDH